MRDKDHPPDGNEPEGEAGKPRRRRRPEARPERQGKSRSPREAAKPDAGTHRPDEAKAGNEPPDATVGEFEALGITPSVGVVQDATERKQAEHALRVFEDAVENSTDAIGMSTPDGRHYYQNRAFDRLFGNIGENPPETLYVERKVGDEVFRTIMAGGQWTGEVRMYAADRRVLDIFVRAYANRDENGNVLSLVGIHNDITARKQVEEALRESEERHRILFMQAKDALMTLAPPKWNFTSGNPAIAKMFGAADIEAFLALRPWDISPPCQPDGQRSSQKALAMIAKAMREGGHHFPWTHRRLDGTDFPAMVTLSRVQRAGETFLYAVVRDITGQKQAEEALRKSEARYQETIASIREVVWRYEVDAQGRVVDSFVSPVAERMLGLPEGAIGGNFDRVFAQIVPEDRAAVQQALASALAAVGRTVSLEHRVRTASGSVLWCHGEGTAYRQPNGHRTVFGTTTDITERKRAEEALRESEAAHRLLAENSVDMISRHAADGTVLYVSPSCESLTGYAVEELLGKPAEFLVFPGDRGRVWDTIRRVPPSENRYLVEHRMRRKDGTIVWVESHGRLVRDAAGHVHEIQCSVRDITERKRAEEALQAAHEELQRAHDELEQRVEARTADLAAANAQLRRERKTLAHLLRASDHERQLIAYDIHDGLAQELAGAIMQLQFYQQQKEVLPKEARQALDSGLALLERGHREARRLISGVRPPILDESGILAAVAHLAYDPAFEQGPKVELHSRVAFRRLDPVAENVVYRVVQEALGNARSYSRSPRIVVSLVQRGDCLRIQVRDWGVGFDPGEVPENRFGLEGMRERARLLGGRCRIRSRPGRGTSVLVELPVIEPHAGEVRPNT